MSSALPSCSFRFPSAEGIDILSASRCGAFSALSWAPCPPHTSWCPHGDFPRERLVWHRLSDVQIDPVWLLGLAGTHQPPGLLCLSLCSNQVFLSSPVMFLGKHFPTTSHFFSSCSCVLKLKLLKGSDPSARAFLTSYRCNF